jgi:hypothetical protein
MAKWFLPNLTVVTINNFGEVVLDQDDIFDYVMQGRDVQDLKHATVDDWGWVRDLERSMQDRDFLATWRVACSDITLVEFDHQRQAEWLMPPEYRCMDIAAYVLGLCDNDAQLQRAGQELLMFQERDLFPMLRYLKYLVDVMREHSMIWGVGRGSSVASYVLYLMGVHRIDSLYYDLDPGEFLR